MSAAGDLHRDPTMGRGALPALGTHVHRAPRIGVSAIISPLVTIGEEAVVGAGSLVRADVPARTVVVGIPALRLRDVRDDELLDERAPAINGTSSVVRQSDTTIVAHNAIGGTEAIA